MKTLLCSLDLSAPHRPDVESPLLVSHWSSRMPGSPNLTRVRSATVCDCVNCISLNTWHQWLIINVDISRRVARPAGLFEIAPAPVGTGEEGLGVKASQQSHSAVFGSSASSRCRLLDACKIPGARNSEPTVRSPPPATVATGAFHHRTGSLLLKGDQTSARPQRPRQPSGRDVVGLQQTLVVLAISCCPFDTFFWPVPRIVRFPQVESASADEPSSAPLATGTPCSCKDGCQTWQSIAGR